ncbi:hypothetical protein GCM10018787_11820 [Streptomyces thermodiastaticus]|nr:hypothetical protein GCM10018787_11820 [Streptomyces thermodiastaticus]
MGSKRTRQRANAGRDVTQITTDVHVQVPPARKPDVSWPVWVGNVPRLAAAFQPRAAARAALDQARDEHSVGGSVLSQVLVGDGGVGKSQLAAALARELRDQARGQDRGLDLLVWVNAAEPDRIITAYAEAADQLRLPGGDRGDDTASARAFLNWLAATDRRWLVVLDDIADPEAVDAWWPDGNPRTGRVLATTRRRHALLSGQGRRLIPLDLYTPEEATSYLRRRLSDAGYPQLFEDGAADELCHALGLLPLALGHAAAYMINKRCDVGTYLARFQRPDSRLADLLPPEADTEGYGRPVTRALLLSLDAVQTADTTQLTRPLLQLIALMDPLGHPVGLWTTTPVRDHLRATLPSRRRWPRRRQPAVTDQDIHSALDCLHTYALIAQDSPQAPIRMHALTARALRETIAPEALPSLARTAGDAILSLWPGLDHHDRDLSAALRANTMMLDQHTYPSLWRPTTHGCLYRVSGSLSAVGLYEQAVAYNQGLVRRSTDNHGPDHPGTLTARNNLAVSYADAGRHHEALELREHVLADRERILGPHHPDTLDARHNLANSYADTGRHHEALELREHVLADRERILGPHHPDTIDARHNLAISYADAGRHHEALELREHVLADRERILGPHHPDTIVLREYVARARSALAAAQRPSAADTAVNLPSEPPQEDREAP